MRKIKGGVDDSEAITKRGGVMVYHGTKTTSLPSIIRGQTENIIGLFVTDTSERAQLYADAQATREVRTAPRYAAGSAVATLRSAKDVQWMRRGDDHSTLDKCEAVIKTWDVVEVVCYTTASDIRASRIKIDGRYVPTYEWLRDQLGERLIIKVVQ